MNASRGADFGSIWYGLNLLHLNSLIPGGAKFFSALALAGAFAILALAQYRSSRRSDLGSDLALNGGATLALWGLPYVFLFTALNKVYSPQYVLWLTPMAIMAMKSKRLLAPFWIWQGFEGLYHVAIWEYLASFTGAKFGLPAYIYGAISIARALASIYFVYRVWPTRQNWDKADMEDLEDGPSAELSPAEIDAQADDFTDSPSSH
jgi:hypothetical protein